MFPYWHKFVSQTKDAFVTSAKDLVSSGQSITQFVRVIADHCLDKHCTEELFVIAEQILTISNQLTIISRWETINSIPPWLAIILIEGLSCSIWKLLSSLNHWHIQTCANNINNKLNMQKSHVTQGVHGVSPVLMQLLLGANHQMRSWWRMHRIYSRQLSKEYEQQRLPASG